MKTTILTITEIDDLAGATMPASVELAKVHIPPVGEPLKLLVALLQTVEAASKPPKVRKTRKDAGKAQTQPAQS